ncbi:MAG: hypothetical protein ABI658_11130 [Acidimicrobiales bacterium]
MDHAARYRDRGGLVVTVDDSEALLLYDDALDAYAEGRSCVPLLEQCLDRVPLFALARAFEALVTGRPPRWPGWPPATAGLTRRERQHLEIVADVIVGNVDRAGGLAREHLAEFPNDRLIAAAFPQAQQSGESAPRQRDRSE